MSNFNNKNLQNSQTSPPKIQNDNSNLDNSTDFVGYYSNNLGKNLKNKKLQKLNWQNSHRKNDKKSKFGSKYENKEKKLNHSNNYKNSPNNSPNLSQTTIQNQNLEQNSSQEKSFPSFYQKKIPNLSKFQNIAQNIAQNINSQISQIPNRINQNLPNFEPKIPKQTNQSLSQKSKQNEDNQNLDQFQNQETKNSTKNSNSQDSITNSNSEHKIRNNLDNLEQNLQNNLQNQSSKFLRHSNFNPDFKNNLSKDNSNHKSFLDNFNYPNFNPLEQKDSFKANYDLKADNYQIIQKNFKNNSTTISRQFAVRHTYRAGAIVWVKYRGENYYVVFRSLMRPSRGIQLPGGRIERMENVADAVTREVYEEIGIQTRILCPLGYLFTENPTDSFSRMEIYYIVRPIFPIDVFRYWQHQDLDEKRQAVEKRQTLECWCVPCSREVDFLSFEQGKAVLMFRDWLSKHKKPELEHTSNF